MSDAGAPEEILARIEQLLRDREPVLVAIDGRGGAGKTHLADRLAAAFGGWVVHIDDFGRPGYPYDEWDWDRLRDDVIRPLRDGRVARYQRYDWRDDRLAEWHEVAPAGVVIVEGVSSTRERLGHPWDVTVWVEAPRELRLDRGVARDGEAMRATWVEEWMPQEDRYVEREHPRDRADFVVRGY
ncbi:MAG TPA: AAA family ATPase [Actinomycetota bacterium]|nr:AAA family ATPase [Actinomycetota bacterium]